MQQKGNKGYLWYNPEVSKLLFLLHGSPFANKFVLQVGDVGEKS